MLCKEGLYFAGTECKPNMVLQLKYGSTPGIILSMKSRLIKNFEWTLETWAYVDSTSGKAVASIFVLDGDGTKLSARSSGETLVGEWIYDSMGNQMTISTFSTNVWHHVAIVTKLESPYYNAQLFLDGNALTSQTVEIIVKSNVKTFEYLTLGMDRSDYAYMGVVALKEVRVWDVAIDATTLARQMRRQIRRPETEIRLVYYYPIDSTNSECLYDRAFEGDLQDFKLWNTAHTYTANGPDPSTIGPPNLKTTFELGLPPLLICDQNSYFSPKKQTCQKDTEESPIGLELSLSPFTIPLTSYKFHVEWTFEFWMLINQIGGVSTSIFSQTCYPSQSGTLSLKKVGVANSLAFMMTDSGYNVTFAQARRGWTHFAFMNDATAGRIFAYKNGVKMDSDMPGVYTAIPSCALTVGEFSTINLIYGKLKEIRIWNGTRTNFELVQSMHRSLDSQRDRSLAFYLPMSESSGGYVYERVKNTAIGLTITKYSRELWTAQGDLHICRTPYVYSPADNVCICKSDFANNDDRPKGTHTGWR